MTHVCDADPSGEKIVTTPSNTVPGAVDADSEKYTGKDLRRETGDRNHVPVSLTFENYCLLIVGRT